MDNEMLVFAKLVNIMLSWQLLFVVIILVIFWRFTVTIQEGESAILERFGKYHRTLGPGFHFLLPSERVRSVRWTAQQQQSVGSKAMHVTVFRSSRVPLCERIIDLPPFNVLTKDRIQVEVDVVLFYRIEDPKKAVYAVEDLHAALQQTALTTIRMMAASMYFEEIINGRDALQRCTSEALQERRRGWGTQVRIDIQNLQTSNAIMKATELAVAAQRKMEAEMAQEKARLQSEMVRAENESRVAMARLEHKHAQMLQEMKTLNERRMLDADTEARCHKILREAGMSEEHIIRRSAVQAWGIWGSRSALTSLVLPPALAKELLPAAAGPVGPDDFVGV